MTYLKPLNEDARVRELHSLNILDTHPEERFDRYTRLIADIFDVPVVAISLVDSDRQWFKSIVGCQLRQTSREESICTHTLNVGYLEIPDLLEDPFFKTHPAAQAELSIRFYAGSVIFGPTGKPIGVLCLIDRVPRVLNDLQRWQLKAFAQIIQHEINRDAALESERQLFRDSTMRDISTGLPGEALLNESLERLIDTAKADQHRLAIMHLHVENLGTVANLDRGYGQNTMIKALVDRLVSLYEGILSAGRIGHDRLVLVVPAGSDVSSRKQLLKKAERILKPLVEPVEFEDRWVRPEINLGISRYPEDGEKAHPLIEMARRAFTYSSAHHRIHFFDATTDASAARRHMIHARLEMALLNNQITLNYQPIWRADGTRIVKFEALARWQDEKLGVVSPGEFIPIAEKDAWLSNLLTYYVLRMACKEARSWQTDDGQDPLRIAVNIPAREFYQCRFATNVFGILRKVGLEPDRLTLELTEESLVQDIEQTTRTMAKLSEKGIRLAIDDFGTGYSSLNHLSLLPVNILKIDKSFIDTLQDHHKVVAFISGFISIAHAMELTVVAEGVEHEAQRELLAEMGCDMIQGYLLGRPVPPERISELLKPT